MVSDLYVLIIDDREDMINLFSKMLESVNKVRVVHTCRSISEAIELTNFSRVNVAILDLFLEETNGIDTVIKFRHVFPTLPFIVTTGYDINGLSYQCFEHGASDYLSKPDITPMLLYKACLYAVERHDIQFREKVNRDTLHSLLDVAPIGIAMLVERKLMWVNNHMCNMVKKDKSELEGHSSRVLYSDDEEYERVGREKYPAVYQGKKGVVETTWVTKFGKEIDVLLGSAAIGPGSPSSGIILTALDITTIKELSSRQKLIIRSLKILNKSYDGIKTIEELLRLIQEFTKIEAIGIRLQDGNDYPYFVYKGFNAKFIELENSLCPVDEKGCPKLDCEGRPVLDCMCGCVIRGNFRPELPCFTKGGSFWTNSTTDLHRNDRRGEILAGHGMRDTCNVEGYESVAIVPLRVGEEVIGTLQLNDQRRDQFCNKFIEFIEELAISIAVAVKRSWQEDRIKSLEIAKTKDLLRSSRLLNSGIAHELRTPMQALLNCLELIKEEVSTYCNGIEGNKTCETRDLIIELANDGLDRTEYSVKVLNSLSEYSKIASGDEIHLINIVPELKTIMRTLMFTDQFKSMNKDSFELVIEGIDEGCYVYMNRIDFSQLITNLCRNAREAIDHDKPKVSILVIKDASNVVIKIIDNGRGIDSNLRDKIFEPYFSTKENPDGYNQGLGLAMVREIITAYGGSISYTSKLGNTEFIIKLPCEEKK